ncbi:YopX family protein [Campylobacter coli]
MKLKDFDFRIWDGKKYINNIKGGVYIHKINDHIKCLNRNQDCYDYEFELDELDNSNLEIELFTGLYDKKGKKVYENDIVKVKSLYNYFLAKISIHKEGTFYFEGKNGDYIGSLIYLVEDEGYTIEAIGNIHENAELLK